MAMREVSRYFDRVSAADPASGAELFKCQFANYDGSKRDAFAAYRRVISTDPDVAIPASRCISAMGGVWIVGDGHPDGWETLHRRKYVAQRALGQAQVQTLAQRLNGDAPAAVWADMRWVSDTAEQGESSDRPPAYVAVLPAPTAIKPYDLITLAGQTMLVRSVGLQSSGLLEARGLVEPAQAASTLDVTRRTFVPATGGYTAATVTTVRTFKARWQELFVYADQLDERFQEGDEVFAVPAGTDARSADVLVFGAQRYLVKEVKPIAGVLTLHARPAA